MNSKKILAGVLAVAVLATSGGIYYYKAKTKADTATTLAGTRLQMVDTAGAVVKQNVPLELSFKAEVRVCKKTSALFIKVSTCKWEDRNFKRVALTSNEGTYTVGTESYRPLTIAEAKIVVQNLATEKAGRALLPDETARLDRVTLAAAGTANPTNAQVEGMVQEAFKGYVPPATDEEKVISKGNNPVSSLVVTAATTGAAVAAGSALTLGTALVATGASLGTAATIVGGVATGSAITLTPAVVTAVTNLGTGVAGTVASGASSVLGAVSSGAQWLFTNPYGWAVLAGVILLACISTKTTEKWFTLKTVDVKTAGDAYKGSSLTLYFEDQLAKSAGVTSAKYVKDAKFAVDLNDFDSAFYSAAADQMYAKFIAANTTMSDASKNNYKTLLAANVAYLQYARLHGYSEANNNKAIQDTINSLVNNNVIVDVVNLVKNGSFEDNTTGWVVRHVGDGATEQIITGVATSTCTDGNKCLKLASNKGTYQGAAQTFTNLEAGQKYRFSADYRTEGTGTLGEINIYDGTKDKQYPIFAQGDLTWKRVSVEIPVVTGSSIEVLLYGDNGGLGSGTVYWDNAVFEKVIE